MNGFTMMRSAAELGSVPAELGLLVRPIGSEAMSRANTLVGGWMDDAGREVRQDPAGNLIGRYDGSLDGGRTLLLGSHLDTVRDAGCCDGPSAVLVSLACVDRLHRAGKRPRFALEPVVFSDEEGLRFGTTSFASSVFAGRFGPEAS